jgi:hypothetical protein
MSLLRSERFPTDLQKLQILCADFIIWVDSEGIVTAKPWLGLRSIEACATRLAGLADALAKECQELQFD